ncbi:DUF924 family protein [Microbulbifer sp. SA54]|uniref:DUF924 family protein n=1 Tax=Microbulbifer sp. SA54 TaxID=3401577 RepID=UPI003AAD8095
MDDFSKISATTVLSFWFGGAALDQTPPTALRKRWFSGDKAFDEEIRRQFGHVVEVALSRGMPDWGDTLQAQLALVLLCDQFTRNIYRGSALAFAGDPRALATSQAIVGHSDLSALGLHQRAFFGMPLEHSESPEVQAQSVAYFQRLMEDYEGTPESQLARSYFQFAVKHRDVINAFGRFPHRNTALGRTSTADEQRWLSAGGGF